MATGETTVELLDACCRLVTWLNTPQDIPFLSGLIQREIIYRILRGREGARLRAIATLEIRATGRQKRLRGQGELREAATNRGPRKNRWHGRLHTAPHFRTLTGHDPLQYQKQLRLHAARERMLMDSLDAASAAFEVGYESATQFNREYSASSATT